MNKNWVLLGALIGAIGGGAEGAGVGFSYTSEGRAFLLRQFALLRWGTDPDTAASFLLHGGMGPGTPSAAAEEAMTVLGANQAPDFRPKGYLIHIPTEAQLQPDKAEPSLSLRYGTEECRLAVRPLDETRLTLVCEATSRSRKPVEGHVTFLPPAKARIYTAAGKTAVLGESAMAWSRSDIGAWFQYGNVRVRVPAGSKLLWPMKRHNPYKKDGSSSLADARLVLCLPFSSSASKREVTVEVTEPTARK